MGHTKNIFKNCIDYEELEKLYLKSSMFSISYNHAPSNTPLRTHTNSFSTFKVIRFKINDFPCLFTLIDKKNNFSFAEELRLQRNPDNYALLRRYDVTSSSGSPASSASVTTASCSISSNAAMQQQTVPGPPGPSLQQTQASSTLSLSASDSLDDRRDFLITKVRHTLCTRTFLNDVTNELILRKIELKMTCSHLLGNLRFHLNQPDIFYVYE